MPNSSSQETEQQLTRKTTRTPMNWSEDSNSRMPERVRSSNGSSSTASFCKQSTVSSSNDAVVNQSQQWLQQATSNALRTLPRVAPRPIPRELLFRSRKPKLPLLLPKPADDEETIMPERTRMLLEQQKKSEESSKLSKLLQLDDTNTDSKQAAVTSNTHKTLDNWQRSYIEFITMKSTHRYALTGRQIARRRLNTWGRQFYQREEDTDGGESDSDRRNILMVHLHGNVAISFATQEDTIRMAKWLALQRQQYQSRTSRPPDLEVDDTQIRQRMKQMYLYMKDAFRFQLLKEMEIDLSIRPGQTLIQSGSDGDSF